MVDRWTMSPDAPAPPKPPLQLQTTHARWSNVAGLVGTVLVATVALVWPGLVDTEAAASSTRYSTVVIAFGALAGLLAYRRTSGMFVDERARIVSRNFLFDRGMLRDGPSITGLSIRPYFHPDLQRLMLRGDVLRGVPSMLSLTPILPASLRRHANRVVVRHAPVRGWRRGRWQDTGIAWAADDDAFLAELCAYLDAARGIEVVPAAVADGAAATDAQRRVAAHTARIEQEAGQPQFRTTHSRPQDGARWLAIVGYVLVIVALGISATVLATDVDYTVGFDAAVPVGIALVGAVLIASSGVITVQTGVLVKHGRLVTDGDFVVPQRLTIVQKGDATVIAAVSASGKSRAFSDLSHRPDRGDPNELLVRHPKSPRRTEQQWQGTGVFWASDGTAVIEHLERALRGNDASPAPDDALRDAA